MTFWIWYRGQFYLRVSIFIQIWLKLCFAVIPFTSISLHSCILHTEHLRKIACNDNCECVSKTKFPLNYDGWLVSEIAPRLIWWHCFVYKWYDEGKRAALGPAHISLLKYIILVRPKTRCLSCKWHTHRFMQLVSVNRAQRSHQTEKKCHYVVIKVQRYSGTTSYMYV